MEIIEIDVLDDMTNQMHGYICSAPIYEFKGWTFEDHYSSGGPWPLTRHGDPRKKAGRLFWKMYEEFSSLSDIDKALCRVGGGCVKF